ncbi:hypothetical protein WJ0W_006706 [Paenibacillus melissococcoides]|uniref:Uncharacterized protein n=1 Tax=Paenibacillus melissococcoides TaxID=2912268 RepID=A0ABM9GC10_9BACL|nr:hypothetical protein J6TS7_26070 [Paenibacillus dendritiformis]CAH8249521.1 hypothetical protein WJ0W_006706 [Paenibacillus melissococcoides]
MAADVYVSEAPLEKEKYWLSQFEGDLRVLNLPGDYTRPNVQNFVGNYLSFTLGVAAQNFCHKLS